MSDSILEAMCRLDDSWFAWIVLAVAIVHCEIRYWRQWMTCRKLKAKLEEQPSIWGKTEATDGIWEEYLKARDKLEKQP